MITFHTTAEVTPDRQLLVTLPPETPLGKAELVVTISPQTASSKQRGQLRQHFGAIHSGDSRSGDNERIDVDLENAYAKEQ
jgi:hypothetical protein